MACNEDDITATIPEIYKRLVFDYDKDLITNKATGTPTKTTDNIYGNQRGELYKKDYEITWRRVDKQYLTSDTSKYDDKAVDYPSLSYNTCPKAMWQTPKIELSFKISGRRRTLI